MAGEMRLYMLGTNSKKYLQAINLCPTETTVDTPTPGLGDLQAATQHKIANMKSFQIRGCAGRQLV